VKRHFSEIYKQDPVPRSDNAIEVSDHFMVFAKLRLESASSRVSGIRAEKKKEKELNFFYLLLFSRKIIEAM